MLRTWRAASESEAGVDEPLIKLKHATYFFCTKNRHGVNGEKRHLLKMNTGGFSMMSCRNADPNLDMFVIE